MFIQAEQLKAYEKENSLHYFEGYSIPICLIIKTLLSSKLFKRNKDLGFPL